MAAAPSVHTPAQKDQFSSPVKFSFRDLNSSEAVVFLARTKCIKCRHEYAHHKDIEQKLAAQLCFQYL